MVDHWSILCSLTARGVNCQSVRTLRSFPFGLQIFRGTPFPADLSEHLDVSAHRRGRAYNLSGAVAQRHRS